MKKQLIKIKMTAEQMEILAPLFAKVKKFPATGMVIAQIYENGNTHCHFFTPKQLRAQLDELESNLINPLR